MNCPVGNIALTMSERQGIEIGYCPSSEWVGWAVKIDDWLWAIGQNFFRLFFSDNLQSQPLAYNLFFE